MAGRSYLDELLRCRVVKISVGRKKGVMTSVRGENVSGVEGQGGAEVRWDVSGLGAQEAQDGRRMSCRFVVDRRDVLSEEKS